MRNLRVWRTLGLTVIGHGTLLKVMWQLEWEGSLGGDSVYFSRSVMSNSLRSHGLQHDRLPCPSPTPGVHFHWVDDAIQLSHPLSPLLLLPSIFPSSRMSWLFASGGQSIETSASASVLPMNIQDWFPLGLTGLICLQPKGLSRVFSNNTVWKHQFFGAQPSLWSNSHIHTWLLEKP